jgi:hypothetical protein
MLRGPHARTGARIVYLEPVGMQSPRAGRVPRQAQPLSALLDARIAVVRAGARLVLHNDTPVYHRLFSRSEPGVFAAASLASGSRRVIAVPPPGTLQLYCELHPWESATLIATPTAWAARVAESGEFRIEGVAPGTYRVVSWSEMGTRSALIRVQAGQTARIEISSEPEPVVPAAPAPPGD